MVIQHEASSEAVTSNKAQGVGRASRQVLVSSLLCLADGEDGGQDSC